MSKPACYYSPYKYCPAKSNPFDCYYAHLSPSFPSKVERVGGKTTRKRLQKVYVCAANTKTWPIHHNPPCCHAPLRTQAAIWGSTLASRPPEREKEEDLHCEMAVIGVRAGSMVSSGAESKAEGREVFYCLSMLLWIQGKT